MYESKKFKPHSMQVEKIAFPVSSTLFSSVFSSQYEKIEKHEFLNQPWNIDYSASECFLTSNHKAGFSVSKEGSLESVFSFLKERGFVERNKELIKEKAKTLCYICTESYNISSFYQRVLGFVVIGHTIDDTACMRDYNGKEFVEKFKEKYGTPFHVFMGNPEYYKEDKDKVFKDYCTGKNYLSTHL